MQLHTQQLFQELESAQRIVIAGAGGGFDVFGGLPLYFYLAAAGKTVFLANLTFSSLVSPQAGHRLLPNLVEVTADSVGDRNYFPEKYLCEWFRLYGKEVPVYAIARTGPKLIAEAWSELYSQLAPDTIILIDGGADSLMRGDEHGLGTPVEEMSSIAAVDAISTARVPRKILACLGLGVDSSHGVSLGRVLEAVAELTRAGGYLGSFSLTSSMHEVRRFIEATEYVMARTPGRESVFCASVLSAIEGWFGDVQSIRRSNDAPMFINPLMSLCWAFRLEQVARRVLYLDDLRMIPDYDTAMRFVVSFHESLGERRRPWLPVPV